MTIGERIRDARLSLSLTQRQVADTVGVTRGYVMQLERGHSSLTNPETIRAIAATLNIPDLDLFAAAHRIPDDIETWLTDGNTAHLAAVRALMDADEQE